MPDIDYDAAHARPDPDGYEIRHGDDGLLVLIRLSDREELGRFADRDALDAAADADKRS